MADVTQLLGSAAGDPRAAAELLPLVYDELRKLAAARLADEKPGQTFQPNALVHEAYVRLVGSTQPQDWNGRGHFFAAAAEAMRRILVNRARDTPPAATKDAKRLLFNKDGTYAAVDKDGKELWGGRSKSTRPPPRRCGTTGPTTARRRAPTCSGCTNSMGTP